MSCECSGSALTCCPDKNYVQDKVCSPWSATVVATAIDNVLYTNNINQNVVGTGFVKYDVGPGPITVEALDSAGATIDTQTLNPGTSIAFTYRRFAKDTSCVTCNTWWNVSGRILYYNTLSTFIVE